MIFGYLVPDVDCMSPRPGLSHEPLWHEGAPCQPSILRLNRQIHDEDTGLLYNFTATYCVTITNDEVAAFGEKLWATGRSRPPPAHTYALDSRLERTRKLSVLLAPDPDMWHEYSGEPGVPHKLDMFGEFWFRS